MALFRLILLIALCIPAGVEVTLAQDRGSVEVTGRVRIGSKVEKIKRKRFYLFRGGLADNKALVDRIKAATPISRSCFYCNAKASPELIAWLAAEDCESPFCRAVTTEDVSKVPEFKAAYQKGLTQFRNKPDVAAKWLTTNLSPNIRDGFYRQQKSLTETILGGVKPLQSSMTDSVSVRAVFIDIDVKPPAGKTTETFLITNVVPVDVGSKSYVWACEIDIGAAKKATLALQVPDAGKTVRRCEVIVRDLPVCTSGTCPAK
jgi:hypothetical protein